MKTYKSERDGRIKVQEQLVEWDAKIITEIGTLNDFLEVFEPHPNYKRLSPKERTKTLKKVYTECVRATKAEKPRVEKKPEK